MDSVRKGGIALSFWEKEVFLSYRRQSRRIRRKKRGYLSLRKGEGGAPPILETSGLEEEGTFLPGGRTSKLKKEGGGTAYSFEEGGGVLFSSVRGGGGRKSILAG